MQSMELQIWAAGLLKRIEEKYKETVKRTALDFFPYTVKDGRFCQADCEQGYEWWTNGFYPGILWKLFLLTGNDNYKELAKHYENLLDIPLENFEGLHHDVGFMWLTSAVADYRITNDSKSRKRGLHAASVLASRYNIKGNFIRAWNGEGNTGWAIIDSMMNIPILYWAAKEMDDPRFTHIAVSHADKVLENFLRADGSVRHIVSFSAMDGSFLSELPGQGYAECSSWTRGQAWALYGFLLSYLHTGDQKYLDASKRTAHYFIAGLTGEDDDVPPCDFRSPREPVYKDTTAGAIAACGLWELGNTVCPNEQMLYHNGAVKILKGIEKSCCNWNENEDGIVLYGTERYGQGINMPIIYGDYYFLEALMKIRGNDILFW